MARPVHHSDCDQLAQAKANLEQAQVALRLNQANLVLAKITLARVQQIQSSAKGAISQQEIDQDKAAVDVAMASMESARASIQVNDAAVKRYTDPQSFEKITAPFAGVITARHVEVGDLVTADSTTRERYHLMRTDILQVIVNVPQAFATSVTIGEEAVVYRREEPQKHYAGKVTRTANALDPNTRTLYTEVDVSNPEDALRPGMYLQVKFVFDRKVFPLMIPAAALATRTTGPKVAVLDDQNRVHYKDVELGRDYGADVQVLAGLKEGEQVVVHPDDDLAEGTVVQPDSSANKQGRIVKGSFYVGSWLTWMYCFSMSGASNKSGRGPPILPKFLRLRRMREKLRSAYIYATLLIRTQIRADHLHGKLGAVAHIAVVVGLRRIDQGVEASW
jgi:RND family efflux transporter MFP subunit